MRRAWMGWIVAVALASNAGAEEPGFPRTLTDGKGHQVTLARKPVRIASLTLGTDENLLDLVARERLVAMCVWSKEPCVSNVADRMPEGPVLIEKEWEKVRDLRPDLVLVARYSKGLTDPLIAAGLPVYEFTEFYGMDALMKNLEILGRLTGEEAAATKLLEECRARLSAAAERRPKERLRAVYYSEGKLSAGGTTPSDVLIAAGLVDACAEFGMRGTVAATPELIENLRPDVIFIGEDQKQAEEETLKMFASPEYAAIPAVQAGKVFAIPGKHITTVSWHIVEAVEDVQSCLR